MKYILLIVFCCILSIGSGKAITDPSEKYPDLDLYLESPTLVRESPSWFVPRSLRGASRDISFWKRVLPYEEDRYADIYMVIPQLWLITPIQSIQEWSSDRSKMLNGNEIGINKYLQWWIIEYAWSAKPWFIGKRIDFGHSNYLKSDAWRYKTIFAQLMWLDPGDEVWYFVRNWDLYDLHTYKVTASYPTSPKNVEALHRDGEGADALIFGCYHWLDGRWMIEAEYNGTPVWSAYTHNTSLSQYRKQRIDQWIVQLERIPLKWRKQHIAYLYSRVQNWEEQYIVSEKEQAVLDYVLERMGELYE